MNVLEFLHRESKQLFLYYLEGDMNHEMYMEARRDLFDRVERWIEKGLTFQTNVDYGRLEEVRDYKT